MDISEIILRVAVGTAFVGGCGAIAWWTIRSNRGNRDRAEQLARQHYEPRGFSIEAKDIISWSVSASGRAHGHPVVIKWRRGGYYSKGVWTEVAVEVPSLPSHFGLELGLAGAQPTNAAYPLVTGDSAFDAAFDGWTDHGDLAPRLLSSDVRRGLLALRNSPGLKLSALNGQYTHDKRALVRLFVGETCLDPSKVDALAASAVAFAEAAAQTFGTTPARAT